MTPAKDNKEQTAMNVAYRIDNALYLNITNRCSNHCVFCIRESQKGVGYNLWLSHEPSVAEIVSEISSPPDFREIVFCGYGEPLFRPEVVREVSLWLKANGANIIRVNTNGLADLFLKHDALPSLEGLIDVMSISLNAGDRQSYYQLTKSIYGEAAFEAVVAFAKRCCKIFPKVILSVVDYPGVDMKKAAEIAGDLGAEFRVRKLQGD